MLVAESDAPAPVVRTSALPPMMSPVGGGTSGSGGGSGCSPTHSSLTCTRPGPDPISEPDPSGPLMSSDPVPTHSSRPATTPPRTSSVALPCQPTFTTLLGNDSVPPVIWWYAKP